MGMEQEKGTTGERGSAEAMGRREKRKAMKKMKRKQVRKEMAERERAEAEARLSDPVEQERLMAAEEEEARRRERELKEFEERERAWLESMELKRKIEEAEREEEERRKKDLEDSRDLENECDKDDDEWEYIEEGPPEIIFQGNEIILRKKKVRVPKKSINQAEGNEIVDRPTSNPLPPETEAFADFQNASSAQQVLESVAHQVPNFGTEQDKAHCPFHLKTGACRFGQRCSRVHFYPDKSCTILMKNMYAGPGIAWEQDEGLEVCNRCGVLMLYTEEEVERSYEEFYEDVHTEFLKYGELVNFKVCRNGSFHLRGNVYVHYRSLESAILAYQSTNGRYFAGKQVQCEFVNISRWKVAICGEYMKSRLKTCSRGSACNFIHCFRNPGGDYEWADYDKPPPRYWIKEMAALFGYSDEYVSQREREYTGNLKESGSVSHRHPTRRSRSRDGDFVSVGSTPSYRSCERYGDLRESGHGRRSTRFEDNGHDESGSLSSDTEESIVDREMCKDRQQNARKPLDRESQWSEYSPGHGLTRKRIRDKYSDDDLSDRDDGAKRDYRRKSSRHYEKQGSEVRAEQKRRGSYAERSSSKHTREGSSTDRRESDESREAGTIRDSSQRDGAKHRRGRNSSRSYLGDRSEEESVGNRRHPRERKGSDPREDASEGSSDQENVKRRRVSDYSAGDNDNDNDKNLESPRDQNNEQRKQRDFGLECGIRGDETDSEAKKSDRSRKREKTKGRFYHRSSGSGEGVRKSPEDYKRERNLSDSSEEESERETRQGRHHRHRRRRSRQQRDKIRASRNIDNEFDTDRCKSREGNVEAMERWKPACAENEIVG